MPAVPLPMNHAAISEADGPSYRQVAAARPAGAISPLGILCRAVSSVGGGFIAGSYFGTLAGLGGALLGVGLLLLSERQSRPAA